MTHHSLIPHTRPSQRGPMLRWLGRMAFVLAVLLSVVLAGVLIAANATLSHVEAATVQAVPVRFDGRALAAISDADMVATVYANGVLKQIPGRRDTLSLLPLPLSSSDTIRREVFVSNSVTSWTQLMAASPDGRKLYVAEVAGEVEDRVERVASVNALPEGRVLSVMDVTSGLVEGRVEVGQNPLVVSVSPDGRFVAVGSSEPNRQLVILPTSSLDDPSMFLYSPITLAGQPVTEVPSLAWHPSGRFMAVNLNAKAVQFYQVFFDVGRARQLRPHGSPVATSNTISEGKFSPDGRHYISTEVNWNTLPAPLGSLFNPAGQLIVTRFDDRATAAHLETARVRVGNSPEDIAISSDGRLIATVNMRRTYLPDMLAWWAGGNLSSVSLAELDQTTDGITAYGEYGFEGLLPEDAVRVRQRRADRTTARRCRRPGFSSCGESCVTRSPSPCVPI